MGDARIGVARGSAIARIAEGLITLAVDGTELERLHELVVEYSADVLVVGVPRNQSGDLTQQSKKIFAVAEHFSEVLKLPLIYQDESLTSVHAEKLLRERGEGYDKGDIDRVAAELILQDFLDQQPVGA